MFKKLTKLSSQTIKAFAPGWSIGRAVPIGQTSSGKIQLIFLTSNASRNCSETETILPYFAGRSGRENRLHPDVDLVLTSDQGSYSVNQVVDVFGAA